ncbi:hypothetical protein I3843_11G172900 [Carya illinoinensis]|uniref:Uncharacterized protein n=1 Tax=Carya illinoinensis TaxID=32201 RepID=A0A922DSF6_CARIL|nr:hypothetical protein I3760_11G172100 [Carya illinoinensis]KAG6689432.1 hypothetical protein I3842_11G174900 [Carya illinoinensis]KAG7957406.1 hypothetical protein I3843_11G172900 [Carya illinoinensis]
MGGNGKICKFEMALKNMQQNRNAVAESVGNKGNNVWRSAGTVTQPQCPDEKKKRRRKEEKAECLFHLVYWGPN